MKMQTKVRRGMALLLASLVLAIPTMAQAVFNSGSDGHDGVLSPTADLVIDMADHPDGIYQYVSVNIPQGVTVSFKPSAANTPVTWLVENDCTIAGTVSLNGVSSVAGQVEGSLGGPGGYAGGRGALSGTDLPSSGMGPGGGATCADVNVQPVFPGNASYGTAGDQSPNQNAPGSVYGNEYILPLIGGSGGAGGFIDNPAKGGGGGGGGAILIAVSKTLDLTGRLSGKGGDGFAGELYCNRLMDASGGGGSGGAIRLIATAVSGSGVLDCSGGQGYARTEDICHYSSSAGNGRIRVEALNDTFNGTCTGVITRGMQNILVLPSNVTPRLSITQVAGVSVPATPSGSATSPDVILPGELSSPMMVVVHAENIPINTPITVDVKPYSGASIIGTAQNVGTLDSSTATVSLDIPRGGGTIMAKAVTAVNPAKGAEGQPQGLSYRDTGLTMDGERFKTAEVSATLGGDSQLVYVAESGKRFPVKAR